MVEVVLAVVVLVLEVRESEGGIWFWVDRGQRLTWYLGVLVGCGCGMGQE